MTGRSLALLLAMLWLLCACVLVVPFVLGHGAWAWLAGIVAVGFAMSAFTTYAVRP